MEGPVGQQLRVIARDIELPGSDVPFVFAVAGDRKELESEIARFDRLLVWSLSGLGLGLIIGIVVLVQVGLKPLRQVSAAIADIRSGRTNHLSGEFPAEIAPLAEGLNALVAHNQALLERARRHVGNLAHALKTPLTVLTNEAHRAEGLSRESLVKQLSIMRAQIDHYLSRARAAATSGLMTSRTQVLPVLADLQRTLARIYAERGLDIALEAGLRRAGAATGSAGAGASAAQAGDWLAFKGEREDLEEMVGNLMDNACKWAKFHVRVTAALEPGAGAGGGGAGAAPRLVLAVEDDGPGLSPEALEKVLKRGARLDESVPGSGLGLSIVRDLAELYGGALSLEKSALGGLRAALTLPAAEGAG
jgi:signal transduction histidine kinase